MAMEWKGDLQDTRIQAVALMWFAKSEELCLCLCDR